MIRNVCYSYINGERVAEYHDGKLVSQRRPMIKPRNSLVVVRLIEKAEYKVGKINVPANNECYCEAEVIAVGPGNVSAEGGRSETFDLKPGQRVWVKHKKKLSNGSMTKMEDEGLPYRDGDVMYTCFEQNSILGVLAEPGEAAMVPITLLDKVTKSASPIIGA